MKPFFATPMYGGHCVEQYHRSMLELVCQLERNGKKLGTDYQIGHVTKEAMVTRARNTLVARFLQTDCDLLFFIDADIGFRPEDAIRQIEAHSKYDLIVAPYLKKLAKPEWAILLFSKGSNLEVHDNGSRYLEVAGGAGGFMSMKRSVVESLMKHALPCRYDSEDGKPILGVQLFRTRVLGTEMGEDIDLCFQWREYCQGKTWCNLNTELVHVDGCTEYKGKLEVKTPVPVNSVEPKQENVKLYPAKTGRRKRITQ